VRCVELNPAIAVLALDLDLIELALDGLDAAYQAIECLADLGQDRRDLGDGSDGGIAIAGVGGAGKGKLVRTLLANSPLDQRGGFVINVWRRFARATLA